MNKVWLVTQDQYVDNQILGVFDSFSEAELFADSSRNDYPDHVLISQYEFGWTFRQGSSSYQDD